MGKCVIREFRAVKTSQKCGYMKYYRHHVLHRTTLTSLVLACIPRSSSSLNSESVSGIEVFSGSKLLKYEIKKGKCKNPFQMKLQLS